MPERIQLSRAKGWRMPADTVKVDRSTPWGNPFVVGQHGTQHECVDLHQKLLAGYVCMSRGPVPRVQLAYREHVTKEIGALRGKHLACWCRVGAPCHADVLLQLANAGDAQA